MERGEYLQMATKDYNSNVNRQRRNDPVYNDIIDQVYAKAEGKNIDSVFKQHNVRYGFSYSDFYDLVSYFNVARLPDIDGAVMPLVGHVIFTRPSLNVKVYGSGDFLDGEAALNYRNLCQNPRTSAFVNDRYGRELLHMLSDGNTSAYMPVFTTRAMTYTVNDVAIKTIEKGHTFFGHVLKYGKNAEDYKVGGTVSIDFRNDRYQSILKAAYIWQSYIYIISKNDSLKPHETYQHNGVLDYAGSIYYFVTTMDMSRLVYWEKLTGVFPKTVPFSQFSYNDAPIVEDKISIEFDYGIRSEPCDPDILLDINTLTRRTGAAGVIALKTGASSRELVTPDSFEKPFGLGDAFAIAPLIQIVKTNGVLAYYLQFVKG